VARSKPSTRNERKPVGSPLLAGSRAPTVKVASTVKELRREVARWRAGGERVALVPTMGALHEGHLALVEEGRRRADRVVASIFVNPTQFAPHEDFAKYPRTLDRDLEMLATRHCDLVWAPEVAEMYPEGFATRVVPAGAAEGLESAFRPHFFAGVATVCCKLFTQVGPDVAIFGEKDFQQLAVVRQVVRDLDLPLEIVGFETVREADGLAMSSRNKYLSEAERRIAPALHSALKVVAADLRAGRAPAEAAAKATRALLAAGFATVDYIEVRDAATLGTYEPGQGRAGRILAAATLGRTRLIDNIAT
jgi:pantoate--beta-alanine ligase